MPAFGAFCSLPIRLGGGATDGWAATQHARAAADLAGVTRTAVLARLSYVIQGDPPTPVLVDYRGVNGVGPAYAPTLSKFSDGIVLIRFPKTLVNEYKRADAVCIRSARATAVTSSAICAQTQPLDDEALLVITFNMSGTGVDTAADVAIYGWVRDAEIGDYDGATDKQDTNTERVPYAWSAYQDYTSALGSAFTTQRTGLVHARKLALARLEAGVQRGAEKINANSHPDTADDMLGEWVKCLRLKLRGTENRQQIRQLAAAQFAAVRGNAPADVDQACADVLGSAFVSCIRTAGVSLSSPPVPTYWPVVNPGLPSFDLGGGTWTSPRAHLTVNINPPADLNDADFVRLINVELAGMLSKKLPAWETFNAAAASSGFLLDISQLDITGLT